MKLSEKIQEALREQQEISLSDPAVQKRLAAQWGYVPAEAQPAPSQEDESVRKSWARFSNELHRSPDAPYPGMSEAFEQHFSQSFTDSEWRSESGTWAAAWKAAKRHGAQPAPSVPSVPSAPDGWLHHAARMAALARKLREPDWHSESIREMQRELCALEEAALAAAALEAKP